MATGEQAGCLAKVAALVVALAVIGLVMRAVGLGDDEPPDREPAPVTCAQLEERRREVIARGANPHAVDDATDTADVRTLNDRLDAARC